MKTLNTIKTTVITSVIISSFAFTFASNFNLENLEIPKETIIYDQPKIVSVDENSSWTIVLQKVISTPTLNDLYVQGNDYNIPELWKNSKYSWRTDLLKNEAVREKELTTKLNELLNTYQLRLN